ncbi:MAG: N-acetylmuramoyl-L-alanine amidase [Clostridia bacterium]
MKRIISSLLLIIVALSFSSCNVLAPVTDITPSPANPSLAPGASVSPNKSQNLTTPDKTAVIEASPTLTPAVTQKATPTKVPDLSLSGFIIGLDPGHQTHGDSSLEPIAPGSSIMKKKVSSGTQGLWSKVPEYKVNLDVALLLRDLLENAGATVIMTRETNDVNISNSQRALLFNEHKTDYALRLHCNGNDNHDIYGAFMLIPNENPFLSDCRTAAELLISAFCKNTDAKNLGITVRDDQTGFCWCNRMIINIEMGHMTNKKEDLLLTDPAYQIKMAQGLFNGISDYFRNK